MICKECEFCRIEIISLDNVDLGVRALKCSKFETELRDNKKLHHVNYTGPSEIINFIKEFDYDKKYNWIVEPLLKSTYIETPIWCPLKK